MLTNREVRSCEDEIIGVLNKYDFPYDFKRIILSNLMRQYMHEADKAIMNETIEEKGDLDNAESVC